MNKTTIFSWIIIIILVAIGSFALGRSQVWPNFPWPTPTPTVTSTPTPTPTPTGSNTTDKNGNSQQKLDQIVVTAPTPGQKVASPLTISGKARGNWFFEGVFPIKIYDSANNVLGTTQAHAQSAWTTTDFVPFAATLNFDNSQFQSGILSFNKDNPSGLAQNDDEMHFTVSFK